MWGACLPTLIRGFGYANRSASASAWRCFARRRRLESRPAQGYPTPGDLGLVRAGTNYSECPVKVGRRANWFAQVAIGVSVFALAGAASSVAAPTQANTLPKSCPSASVVSAALGQKATTPTVTRSTYAITCVYGKSALSTKVTFQVDTASTFAASEKAVAAALPVVKVQDLGKAAWGTKGGSLYVFTGSYTIKILSVLTSLAKLEALAHKLL